MLQLLFYMNIMGALCLVLHMLLFPFEKIYMPPKYRVFLYRVNLMFFIIPLPACLFYLRRYFDTVVSILPVAPFVYSGSHVILHLGQDISFALPKLKGYEILLLLAWFTILTSKYILASKRNHKLREFNSFFSLFQKEQLSKCTVDAVGLVDIAVKELNLKKKPRVILQEGIPSPVVSGVFCPTLCLPSQWNVSEQVYYMAIKHELAHIQHKDLLFQRLSLVARIINWFNPFLYVVCAKMAACDELAADAVACEGASSTACAAYQNVLLDFCDTYSDPHIPVKGFGSTKNSKSLTKERILAMKNKNLNKHKAVKLVAATFMSVVMFSISTIPALAYTLPPALISENLTVNSIDTVNLDLLSSEQTLNSSLTSTHALEYELYDFSNNLDFSKNDWYCIDEDGNISDYTPDVVDPRIIPCNHNYLAAQLSHHTKNSDGSCYVDYYSAKKCSKCGLIVETGHIAKTTFDKCPH